MRLTPLAAKRASQSPKKSKKQSWSRLHHQQSRLGVRLLQVLFLSCKAFYFVFLVTKAATPLPVKAKTPLPVKKESPATSKDSKNTPKTSQVAKKPAESKTELPQEAAAPKPAKQAPKAESAGTVASVAGAAKGWAKIEKGKLAIMYCTTKITVPQLILKLTRPSGQPSKKPKTRRAMAKAPSPSQSQLLTKSSLTLSQRQKRKRRKTDEKSAQRFFFEWFLRIYNNIFKKNQRQSIDVTSTNSRPRGKKEGNSDSKDSKRNAENKRARRPRKGPSSKPRDPKIAAAPYAQGYDPNMWFSQDG